MAEGAGSVGEVDRWKYRRRIVFISLAFSAGVIVYALSGAHDGLDGETRRTAITQAFWAASAIIGAYVFGATWDDKGRP